MKIFNNVWEKQDLLVVYKLVLVLFCTGVVYSADAHPFYVSVTEIHKNDSNHTLEISMKVFVDDFEAGLRKFGHGKVYLGETNESEDADTFIQTYLQRNFKVDIDGIAVPFDFLGKQIEGEDMYLFIEVPDVVLFNQLEIMNYVLCDVYDSQTNIVHYNLPGEIRTLMLSKDKSSGTLSFE